MLAKSKAHTGFLKDQSRIELHSKIIGPKAVVSADRTHQSLAYIKNLAEEILSGAYIGDVRFARSGEQGIIRFSEMIDELNDFYYSMMTHRIQPDKFRKFHDLNKEQVLSDYRISFMYILAYHATLRERYSIAVHKAKADGIDTEDLAKIPSQYFFYGQGFSYWDCIVQEALQGQTRSFSVAYNKSVDDDTQGDITRIVTHDGDMIHCFSTGEYTFMPTMAASNKSAKGRLK